MKNESKSLNCKKNKNKRELRVEGMVSKACGVFFINDGRGTRWRHGVTGPGVGLVLLASLVYRYIFQPLSEPHPLAATPAAFLPLARAPLLLQSLSLYFSLSLAPVRELRIDGGSISVRGACVFHRVTPHRRAQALHAITSFTKRRETKRTYVPLWYIYAHTLIYDNQHPTRPTYAWVSMKETIEIKRKKNTKRGVAGFLSRGCKCPL